MFPQQPTKLTHTPFNIMNLHKDTTRSNYIATVFTMIHTRKASDTRFESNFDESLEQSLNMAVQMADKLEKNRIAPWQNKVNSDFRSKRS